MSESTANEILIYTREDGTPAINVRLDDETIWVTQAQLVELFQSSKANISEHISNVFDEGELDQDAVVREFRTTAADGKSYSVNHYNLDMIISVGYRVKSKTATQFRIWATKVLRDYLVKGFAMDDDKLKNLGGGDYWRELLTRIRDIRSSEKVLYRQVLDLYATSIDYSPSAAESKEFFAIIQNKLHFAAHGQTAAEVVFERADSSAPNMGLTSFSGSKPLKSEVATAKNYLNEQELTKLNTLVSAYFDAAEFRAQNQEPTRMADWLAHLDRLIGAMDAPLLSNAGSVSKLQASVKAEAEYELFRKQLDELPSEVENAYLETIKRAQKDIAGGVS
ncbi:MAG: virulence RhuM family protein [Aurantimicrobium sp.]|uniref:virulence RhuM family protein n=2 Tax=Aurantimicrobium sp. TaxID=1930784 RepID=UPI002FCBC9D8